MPCKILVILVYQQKEHIIIAVFGILEDDMYSDLPAMFENPAEIPWNF